MQADAWHAAVEAARSVKIEDLVEFCTVSANGQSKPRKGWKPVLAVLQRYQDAPLLNRKAPADAAKSAQEADAAAEGCQEEQRAAVRTIGDLMQAMMEALRSPNEAWSTLLVTRGPGGQKPKEDHAPELKSAQIKENALLAAFHAQVQAVERICVSLLVNLSMPSGACTCIGLNCSHGQTAFLLSPWFACLTCLLCRKRLVKCQSSCQSSFRRTVQSWSLHLDPQRRSRKPRAMQIPLPDRLLNVPDRPC